jgi:hypothetical protein
LTFASSQPQHRVLECDPVKILFSLEGGFAYFPGLAQPREVDTEKLPEHDARALRDCVSATHLLELPEGAPTGFPDARTYTITVIDGTRSRTVHLSDPLQNPSLEELVGLLRKFAQ